MPDAPDESLELMKAVAEGTAEGAVKGLLAPIAAFAAAVFGSPAKEVGAFLTDHVRFQRFKMQAKVLGLAQEMLRDAGVEPKSVSLKILVPLLEGAANEDDDESMAARWAALLANAAAGADGAMVRPGFAAMLAEFGPAEVTLLDLLYRPALINAGAEALTLTPAWRIQGTASEPLRELLRIDSRTFAVIAENLIRLGLAGYAYRSGGASFQGAASDIRDVNDAIAGTALGEAFVRACNAPPRPTGARNGAHEGGETRQPPG